MKQNNNFDYNDSYYETGIGGFHSKSKPIINSAIESLITLTKADELTIVDFGCGNGFHGEMLKSKSTKLIGVDFSKSILNSRNKDLYDELFFLDLGKAQNFENRDTYDLLFSVEVIEHVEDYNIFLQNAHKLLKDDGFIFLTTTTYFWSIFLLFSVYWRKLNVRNINLFFKGLWGRPEDKTKFVVQFWDFFTGHYHGFSKRQLTQAFQDNGFEILEVRYLKIQNVFPIHNLKKPIRNLREVIFLLPISIIWLLGTTTNFIFRNFIRYAPNILFIARK